tara:strand:- start:19375 stop:19953 length:579 start_codon:yes stop_codon:yes gene_type:complete
MIRFALSLSLLALITACGSLRPINDDAKRTTLVLPIQESIEPLYPAPVFAVSLPSYLNETTVWYSDLNGTLYPINNFIWASSLSRAIGRELSIGLAQETPFPANSRIEVRFGRFILLDDGSGLSISEVLMISPMSSTVLPIVKISPKDIWDPTDPSSYLEGYRKLLADTVTEIKSRISEPDLSANAAIISTE